MPAPNMKIKALGLIPHFIDRSFQILDHCFVHFVKSWPKQSGVHRMEYFVVDALTTTFWLTKKLEAVAIDSRHSVRRRSEEWIK
jgi:hypothetical protein